MAEVRTLNVAAPSTTRLRVGEPFSVPLGRLVGRADLRRFIEGPHSDVEKRQAASAAVSLPPLAGDLDDLVVETAVATTPAGTNAPTAHVAAPPACVESLDASSSGVKRTRGAVPDLLAARASLAEPEAGSGEGSGRAAGKRRRGQHLPGGRCVAVDESSEEEDGSSPVVVSGVGASLAAAADALSGVLQRAVQDRQQKPPRGDTQG